MIGNRVKVYRAVGNLSSKEETVTGTLEKLDTAGAIIIQESRTAEYNKRIFIPMHKLLEIVDLGRAPRF